MGFIGNLFSKVKKSMDQAEQDKIKMEISKFEDKYYTRIEKFHERIDDLIDDKIDIKKNEGMNPDDIMALFDSVVVKYAEDKIFPFFESKSDFTFYYIEAYDKLIKEYIEEEKQRFINSRLDDYKEAFEKEQRRHR